MKLAKWEFNGLVVGMIEDENGELFCTTNAIVNALGVPKHYLYDLYRNNKSEFDFFENRNSLRVGKNDPKEFLKANKSDLGIKRIKGDMRFWSEDEMITFAFHVKSEKAMIFRCELRKFIKENARKNYVTQDQYNVLARQHDDLKDEVSQIKNMMVQTSPAMQETASLIGRALQQQRMTKRLRQQPIMVN